MKHGRRISDDPYSTDSDSTVKGLALRRKWRFYSKRYGAVSALFRYIGRRWPDCWAWLGPVVTQGYLREWLRRHGCTRILNLGGGSNLRDEWLTADVDPRADVFMDCRKPLPLEESSFDAVMCEEVIEHLELRDAAQLLRKCKRILRPGGVLRLATPDLTYFTRLLERTSCVAPEQFRPEINCTLGDALVPAHLRRVGILNGIFYAHGHRFIYDAEALKELLLLTGFHNITGSAYQDPESRLAHFDSHAARFGHAPEISIYYECEKPHEEV
jgi:SAM-dependent methyltransferase